MASRLNEKIKDYIIAKNLLTEDKFSALTDRMTRSDKGLEDALVSEGIVKPEDLARIKGEIFGLPMIDLAAVQIPKEVSNILPLESSTRNQAVVFARDGRLISIGLVDPSDLQANEAISFAVKAGGYSAKYYAISLADFRAAIGKGVSGNFDAEIISALKTAEQKFAVPEEAEKQTESDLQLQAQLKSAPVAKIVSVIVRHAAEGGASDIHIEPSRGDTRVRFRIDGILRTSITLPAYVHTAVVSRIKVLSQLKIDETRIPQDGRIRMNIEGQDIDLRVSVLPMLDSEKIVIRILNAAEKVPTLEELGYYPYHIKTIQSNIIKPYGLILLTGPTGSGKTTTMYSLLNLVKNDEVNITTLEDPIEYYMEGVNQSQINPDVGFFFASGLRAILRQDPNIIMVGEVRDNETAELVIQAGLTGHLVFSTLHTNNAWGAVPRLADMKAQPFLLASTLNVVIAQRLVRKMCDQCKEEVSLPEPLLKKVMEEISKIPESRLSGRSKNTKFYHGKGCEHCNNTGYFGRTIIGELIEVTPEVRNLISREVLQGKEVDEQLKQQDFITLFQDGLIKAMDGVTTIDEVLRVTQI